MKRIESFLDEYSWLLKSGIWLVLVLYAAQFHCVIGASYEEIKNMPPRNIEIERVMGQELTALSKDLIEKAKSKGNFYGPEDYFDDLKEMKKKQYELGKGYAYEPPFHQTDIGELQHLMQKNIGDIGGGLPYTYSEVSYAAEKYSTWLSYEGGPVGDEFHSKIESGEITRIEICRSFLSWFWKLYFRGIFLVIFLYVIRMATRKGVLETIFADKSRFIYSVILWPIFLVKYPSNVVKEIVVEAELRRMGNLFRKFTLEEKELVRRVAESANFWSWIFNFHSENRDNFQRSLVVVLAVTILVNLVPFQVQAGDFDQCELTRDGPEIVSAVSIANIDIIDKQEICDCFKGIVLFDDFLKLRANLLVVISFFRLRIFWAKEFFQKIDHVPIGGCLFAEVVLWESK